MAGTNHLIDVLLLQLGTPKAPTAQELRPYLREFLGDPRVIEGPAWVRWFVSTLVVRLRSPKSAAKYQHIWSPESGSPLLSITQKQCSGLQQVLGDRYRVNFAMRYGEPSIPSVVRRLCAQKCERMVVIPMFPQYSATTTASGFDALVSALQKERVVPSIRFIRDFHLDDAYINAVLSGIRREQDRARAAGKPVEVPIVSFHGIPIDYVKRGDPYMRQSAATGKEIARRMGWSKGEWRLCFQSRFGRQKWLTPYTDETLKELGRQGVRSVLVVQPGFTTDCLETIDEIGREGSEEFASTGGEHLWRVPCLNDDLEFMQALGGLVEREAHGWV